MGSIFGRTIPDSSALTPPEDIRINPWSSLGMLSDNEVGNTTKFITDSLAKMYYSSDNSPTVSREIAKNLLGEDIGRPVSESELKWLKFRKDTMEEKQWISEHLDPTYSNIPVIGGKLGTLFGSIISDPLGMLIGMGAGKIVGAGTSSLVKRMSTAMKASKAVGMATKIFSNPVTQVVGEGMLETAISQPIEKYRNTQFNMYYGPENAAQALGGNILGNALGKAAFYGLKGVFTPAFKQMPEAYKKIKTAFGIVQAEEGKTPNGKLADDIIHSDMYEPRAGQTPVNFINKSVEELKTNKVMFTHPLGEKYGSIGMPLIDTEYVARNSVARKIDGSTGRYLSVDMSKANLIDIEAPAPKELKDTLSFFLDSNGIKDIDIDNTPIKKILDTIGDTGETKLGINGGEGLIDEFNALMSLEGIDGYKYTLGTDTIKHNAVQIINPEKVSKIGDHTAAVGKNEGTSPKVQESFDKLQEHIDDPSKDILHVEEFKQDHIETELVGSKLKYDVDNLETTIKTMNELGIDKETIDQIIKEHDTQVKSFPEDSIVAGKEISNIVEKMKKEVSDTSPEILGTQLEMFKALVNCVIKG
jgi:hypothetical protein